MGTQYVHNYVSILHDPSNVTTIIADKGLFPLQKHPHPAILPQLVLLVLLLAWIYGSASERAEPRENQFCIINSASNEIQDS